VISSLARKTSIERIRRAPQFRRAARIRQHQQPDRLFCPASRVERLRAGWFVVDVRVRRGLQLPRRLFGSEGGVKRIVQPEMLDTLPPDDPRALRSRRDLRRVNAWMGNAGIMARALKEHWLVRPRPKSPNSAPAMEISCCESPKNEPGPLTQHCSTGKKMSTAETLCGFARLGWRAEASIADVFDWPESSVKLSSQICFFIILKMNGLPNCCELSAGAQNYLSPSNRVARRCRCFSAGCSGRSAATLSRGTTPVSVRAGFSGRNFRAYGRTKQTGN
jgi:hypothetical protein